MYHSNYQYLQKYEASLEEDQHKFSVLGLMYPCCFKGRTKLSPILKKLSSLNPNFWKKNLNTSKSYRTGRPKPKLRILLSQV
jgi:hypothetical protein